MPVCGDMGALLERTIPLTASHTLCASRPPILIDKEHSLCSGT